MLSALNSLSSAASDHVAMYLFQVTDSANGAHLKWMLSPPGQTGFSGFGFKEFPLDRIYRDNWAAHNRSRSATVALRGKVMEIIDSQWKSVDDPIGEEILGAARWLVERLPGPLNRESLAGTSPEIPWFLNLLGRLTKRSVEPTAAYHERRLPVYVSAVVGGISDANIAAVKAVQELASLVVHIGAEIDLHGLEADVVFLIDGPVAQGFGFKARKAKSDPAVEPLVIHVPVRLGTDQTQMRALIRNALEFTQARVIEHRAKHELSDGDTVASLLAIKRVLVTST